MKKTLFFVIFISLLFSCYQQKDKTHKVLNIKQIYFHGLNKFGKYPSNPDSVIYFFYRAIDKGLLYLAYQYVDNSVFGTYDYFSSEKGFGNISSIKVDKLFQLELFYLDIFTDTVVYYAEISQTNKDKTQNKFRLFLYLSKERLPKIINFRIIPDVLTDTNINKLSYKLFEYNFRKQLIKHNSRVLKWKKNKDFDYYILYLFESEKDSYYNTLLLSYKLQGDKVLFSDFIYLLNVMTWRIEYLEDIFRSEDYDFIAIHRGINTTSLEYYIKIYTPWLSEIEVYDDPIYAFSYYYNFHTFSLGVHLFPDVYMEQNAGKIFLQVISNKSYELNTSTSKYNIDFKYYEKLIFKPDSLKFDSFYITPVKSLDLQLSDAIWNDTLKLLRLMKQFGYKN